MAITPRSASAILLAGIAAAISGTLVVLRHWEGSAPDAGRDPVDGGGRLPSAERTVATAAPTIQAEPTPAAPDVPVAAEDQQKAAATAEPQPVDQSASQPRRFVHTEFRSTIPLREGYLLEGARLTARGVELEPLPEGTEPSPRFGTISSAPERFDFESNSVAALLRDEVPPGTDIYVELAMSPDGENWTDWFVTAPDPHADVAPAYPDGTPNPNYGFTPMALVNFGLNTWPWYRYRATLYSETADSPTLQGFRLYHQDTTLGEGRPVEVSEVAGHGSEGVGE